MNRLTLRDAPLMPQGAVIERTGLILLGELPASALIAAGLWPVFRSPAGAAWVSLRAFQLWWAAQQYAARDRRYGGALPNPNQPQVEQRPNTSTV